MAVGINGMGRMGRLALRAAMGAVRRADGDPRSANRLDVVHLNEIKGGAAATAHLLEFDSIHGRWYGSFGVEDDGAIRIDNKKLGFSAVAAPGDVPWGDLGCDIVLECTGKFLKPADLEPYFDRGVKRVIVAAPVKHDSALNVVVGVNDSLYDPARHRLLTAASCTTNCLAPVVKVIHESIGIKHGQITTIHDPTNTNVVVDAPHKDLRRARSAMMSLQPTTTGSATAITLIYPDLKGKLNGHAVRAPVLNASLTDCVFELKRPTTESEVNNMFAAAAIGDLAGILGYETRPLVSVDYCNDTRSSIVDAPSTMVTDGTLLKVYAWYDNEIGYVCRMVDLANIVIDAGGVMERGARNYLIVTASYWGFTLVDGALRMLVLFHFFKLGYSPFTLAFLFLLYEFAGIVANLSGGWFASRYGIPRMLAIGQALQVAGLLMLSALDPDWTVAASVAWVVAAQGIAGLAKDFTKTASKSAIKATSGEGSGQLFKWVAYFTGSKNAMKGVGFFFGGLLLDLVGFQHALWLMAAIIGAIFVAGLLALPRQLGKAKASKSMLEFFAKSRGVNLLAAARIFMFGAREVWFMVGVPVFLYASGWKFLEVGGYLAAWTIAYGIIQALAPALVARSADGLSTEVRHARLWAAALFTVPVVLALLLRVPGLWHPDLVLVIGLAIFGIPFAVNSSLHSYLILAYAGSEKAAEDVGFYYAANAAGRLLGILLSGALYQAGGIVACLAGSSVMLFLCWGITFLLPLRDHPASKQEAALPLTVKMSLFERYLTLWVALCIAAGVGLGQIFPALFHAIGSAEVAHVNLPVAVLIWLMIIPMLLKVDFAAIGKVREHWRGIGVTLFINWAVKPFSMAALGWLFIGYLFRPWLPAAQIDSYIAGLILLAAAPCTAMVFVWSNLSDGEPDFTLTQVALNDTIMVFAFAPIVGLLLGLSAITIPWETLLLSVGLYIVVPVIIAQVVRRIVLSGTGPAGLAALLARLQPISLVALLTTLVLLFGFQGEQIIAQPLTIALLAVPILIQVYFNSGLAYLLNRATGEAHCVAAPSALIGASNFFELAVAAAISIFGFSSGAALATVVGVLIEVPVMLSVVKIVNASKRWYEAGDAVRARG